MVQSHLIRYGFVKDYTIWKFHGEGDTSDTGASERNSLTTTSSVNERGQQPSSSSAATAGTDSANRDYVNIDELLQDIMASNDGDGDFDEQDDVLGPEDAEFFENFANHMEQDDILFGNPKWLEF